MPHRSCICYHQECRSFKQHHLIGVASSAEIIQVGLQCPDVWYQAMHDLGPCLCEFFEHEYLRECKEMCALIPHTMFHPRWTYGIRESAKVLNVLGALWYVHQISMHGISRSEFSVIAGRLLSPALSDVPAVNPSCGSSRKSLHLESLRGWRPSTIGSSEDRCPNLGFPHRIHR